MQTKRIEYLDALRGFTMFLVVFSHIWTFGSRVNNMAPVIEKVLELEI